MVMGRLKSSPPPDSSRSTAATRLFTGLRLISLIRLSAFSSLLESSSITLKAMEGYFLIRSFRRSPWRTHMVVASSAWAKSVSGREENRDSSPMNSPGPAMRRTCSLPPELRR